MTAVEGHAIIGTPSPSKLSAAPRIKSTCPPTPNEQKEQIFGENESKFYQLIIKSAEIQCKKP